MTCDREHSEGDFKLYGRAVEIEQPEQREAYRVKVQARIGWAPEEPEFHLFALDVERAAYLAFGERSQRTITWDLAAGLRD